MFVLSVYKSKHYEGWAAVWRRSERFSMEHTRTYTDKWLHKLLFLEMDSGININIHIAV
jgi:hypothetical protein